MPPKRFALLRDLKLTQKIFFIFVLMIFIVVNSWAFTFTTVLDFQESFATVEQYAFPSIITTAELKDDVHIALLAVYNYVTTNEPSSKTAYQDRFTKAIQSEYRLFQLSQTATDFSFTQQFNEKLLAIYNKADELVALYEAQPDDPAVNLKLTELNELRDSFNDFLETEITSQITLQIEQSTDRINATVRTIRYSLLGVALVVIGTILFLVVFISSNITKPVAALTKATKEFGKGHFTKVAIARNDELGLFAETFNTMATNIQASQAALEEELAKTKELDRQKSEFLSIAAHQLRTPMSGIRWAAQMLFDGDMGAMNTEQKHHLGNALDNINRMVNLINDLLDVTKIEEQKFNYKFVRQDLGVIIQSVIKDLAGVAKENRVAVQLTCDPSEKVMLDVDREKITLAMNNLIDNAIKYSKPGQPVTVQIRRQGASVEGCVRDQGLGIPEKSQAEVFTKFFRGPNVLKVVTEGSGLGLFLVKDIITKHDGKVWFESKENVGTTFYFTLPVHRVSANVAASATPTLQNNHTPG